MTWGSCLMRWQTGIEYLITQVYEKEIVAARSQVKYLQSQINPHFQFNILAMLSLKAKMAGNEEVYDGLNAFSRLMQGKIFREKEIKIKVKRGTGNRSVLFISAEEPLSGQTVV